MNKTKIEWCDCTWNPVVGCKHGCEYCYARRIAERFGGYDKGDGTIARDTPFPISELSEPMTITRKDGKTISAPFPFCFEPTFFRYRLDKPKHLRKRQNIFVCSMADLFGRWVPEYWIQEVLDACIAVPRHRYLFLTKNPLRYLGLDERWILPRRENFWYGSTVTNGETYAVYSEAVTFNTFWSVEPLIGPVDFARCAGLPKWIIIGAMTGPDSEKHQPKAEWIADIVSAADSKEIPVPVFMKDSLIPIIGEENMRREFPWE